MMKRITLLLLLCLIAGCSTTQRVRVNVGDGTGYAVYMNDEMVCSPSASCIVDISAFSDDVVLDARKDNVVYGRLVISKQAQENPEAARKNMDALGSSLDAVEFVTANGKNPVLTAAAAMLTFPVSFLILSAPSKTKSFPEEVRIPVAVPNTSQPYPWGEPAKD